MNVLSENKDIIIPIVTLILGSWLTFGIQRRLSKQQIEWEKEKNESFFQHELEKMELQFYQEQLNYRMSYYNKILKAIKSTNVYEVDIMGEHTFNYGEYLNVIKPILYENLHFLPNEIIEKMDLIDNVISRQNYYEEEYENDAETCGDHYEDLSRSIQEEVEKFRNKHFEVKHR